MPMLRLLAKAGENGGPLVPDYDMQAQGLRVFIGRRLDPNQGVPFKSERTKQWTRHAVFVPKTDTAAFHEVEANGPHTAEYLRHIKDGDLLPGDAYTAKRAGVKFDASYAGAAMWGDAKASVEAVPTTKELLAAAQKTRGQAPAKSDAPPTAEDVEHAHEVLEEAAAEAAEGQVHT